MKLTYRPEIDGLRAIAVGAVILYHAQITILGRQLFKGGFIGVDIFFVISGYLITSIILKELVATGTFSFKHFYERRVRRILPALLFVMLVSLPFAWMYLLPDSFVDFSKSILYSLGFSSNFYFHYSGQLYGAENGLLKPFLHTWSLSIEEQYYILFPIVLLIIFRYFTNYLIHILILGFIISLGLGDWGSRNYPSASFYLLHTRMWELLAGSILAYFEITLGHRSNNKTLNLILPSIGLFLIGNSILFFNDKIFHPSLYTLLPIIGVCFIIWFSNKDELITKILSTKLFVGVGLISYSLYLWHYPAFAFARITKFFSNNLFKELSLVLLILILSLISYFFIEKPFRNKKFQFKKKLIILSLFCFLIFFNFYVIYISASNSIVRAGINEILQAKLSEKNINFFKKKNTKKAVLIGDSHADSIAFYLNEELKNSNISLFRFPSRMYLKDFNYINRKTKKKDNNLIKNNIKIDNFLNENSNLIVVFHYRWALRFLESYYDTEKGYKEKNDLTYEDYLEPLNIKTFSLQQRQIYFKKALINQINRVIDQGHKVIIVYSVPEMEFHPPLSLHRKSNYKRYFPKKTIPILTTSYESFKKRNKLIFEILDTVKNPNIYRVYPHALFCNITIKNRCVSNDKERLFYEDNNHLSLQGSRFVVNEIMKEIEKIEFKSN